MLGHDRLVGAATTQQATVDLRVQRLDAAVHDLGEAGVLGHFAHGDAVGGQQLGGAAGGEQFDALGRQGLGQFKDAGFVGDGEEGAAQRLGHRDSRLQTERPNCRSFLRSVPRLIPRITAAWLWLPLA